MRYPRCLRPLRLLVYSVSWVFSPLTPWFVLPSDEKEQYMDQHYYCFIFLRSCTYNLSVIVFRSVSPFSHLSLQTDHAEQSQAGAGGLWSRRYTAARVWSVGVQGEGFVCQLSRAVLCFGVSLSCVFFVFFFLFKLSELCEGWSGDNIRQVNGERHWLCSISC